MGRDITDKKQKEQELARHRAHLQELVAERTATLEMLGQEQRTIPDCARILIWYKDTENNILRVNKAAAASAGRSTEEIEGKSAEELFPNEAADYYEDDVEVIQTGEPKLGIEEAGMTPIAVDPLGSGTRDKQPS